MKLAVSIGSINVSILQVASKAWIKLTEELKEAGPRTQTLINRQYAIKVNSVISDTDELLSYLDKQQPIF